MGPEDAPRPRIWAGTPILLPKSERAAPNLDALAVITGMYRSGAMMETRWAMLESCCNRAAHSEPARHGSLGNNDLAQGICKPRLLARYVCDDGGGWACAVGGQSAWIG